jgi:hypothetical protein
MNNPQINRMTSMPIITNKMVRMILMIIVNELILQIYFYFSFMKEKTQASCEVLSAVQKINCR